jgi:hypothetical protein
MTPPTGTTCWPRIPVRSVKRSADRSSRSCPPPERPERPAPQAQGPPEEGPDERREAPEQARARKLEQLKDLYLTAEAIGEHNVDKHFDQLLAQQRELISEYFRQSPAAAQPGTPQPGTPQPGTPQSGVTSQEAGAEPGHRPPGASGGPGTPPEGASVRAEPPRAW